MTMKNTISCLLLLAGVHVPIFNNIHAQNDASTTHVFLDSPHYTVDTQIRALIFKPSSNNLHYAAQATPLPLQSPQWNIYDLHPQYHCGFDLGARVFFHNRKTNLALNFEHFKSRTRAVHEVPISTDMVGPFFEIGPDAHPYQQATGVVHFDFNTVNITYGQDVYFGDFLHTNLFAGINFTRIKQCLSMLYASSDKSISRSIITPATFMGAGPQIGVDFSYNIIKGLNLAGQFTTSLIVGPAKNSTAYSSQSPFLAIGGFTAPNNQSTRTQKQTIVVPEFSERLGIAYSFSFCNHYMAKLEVGYEARIYISALQSVDIGSEVVTPPVIPDTVGVFARTFQKTISNFALTGPYVALNIAF